MDKATEADAAEAVKSPADGSKPTPETDDSVTDDSKGRQNVTAIEDGKPSDSTVRIRPQSAETDSSSWAPGGLSSPGPERPAKKAAEAAPSRSPRKAHLVLRRIEPWSAMKFSFVVSLVCFVVLFVAVAVLYMVLSGLGVFDSIVQAVNQLTTADGKSTSSVDVASWFEPVPILGYTALIGAVNVVLITALSTLGSVIYNIASELVGGVEVTFSEAE
ncbi:Flp pilus assembly pilin Flp [Streptosporangium album]|uniref:Flp pilus assembly pilin Flp n=1 Tax=Streptosporangium album TaxID=47479 RepID=A0A7W7RVU1_9ACTN|nr:DUF3566 domain-containing protein [Streptosporangium album]MBB4938498.1 Flp pilus assembly pilin Flp [Streptosporangium album]